MATIKMDGIPVETATTDGFVCIFASSQVLLSAEELFFFYSLTLSVTILNSLNCKSTCRKGVEYYRNLVNHGSLNIKNRCSKHWCGRLLAAVVTLPL